MRFLAFILAGAALVAAGCGPEAGDGEIVEYAAEEFGTGHPVSLQDLRGHDALLTSWATWCEPCKEELPAIDALYRERSGDGLQVIAVNVNEAGPGARSIEDYIHELGLSMPVWRDADDRFTVAFHGFGVPTNVLIDGEGRVVKTWLGAVDPNSEEFIAVIEDALAR